MLTITPQSFFGCKVYRAQVSYVNYLLATVALLNLSLKEKHFCQVQL